MQSSTMIGLAIIGGLLIYLVAIYNKLVSLKNQFQNAFSQIDVQLQRRHDLIPNLVESTKAFMQFEQETMKQVMDARANAINAKNDAAHHPDNENFIATLGNAESALSGALANFYAVAENYPEFKSSEMVSQLMEELTSTENKVGFARQSFNDSVMFYNTYREQFPNNFLAGFFAFKSARRLELETPSAKKAVKVNLSH